MVVSYHRIVSENMGSCYTQILQLNVSINIYALHECLKHKTHGDLNVFNRSVKISHLAALKNREN
jgi:hypothetical protein